MTSLWDSEPNHLAFEADGLPCVMQRNGHGVWCGYVGVGPDHPLFGLPFNHQLKLPMSWFDGRRSFDGAGVFDVLAQAFSGKELDEACRISLTFEVHGGINYAEDRVPGREQDSRWWFGFDCGHAGDFVPAMDMGALNLIFDEVTEAIPKEARDEMRKNVMDPGTYRDQQYVVGECQSLAAQLNAVVAVIAQTQASEAPR